MTPTEILRAARAKVEAGWCQGPCAIDANGEAVGVNDVRACKWCMFGAINCFVDGYSTAERLLNDVVVSMGHIGFINFNEAPDRTQQEVLAAFDRAIELSEQATTQ